MGEGPRDALPVDYRLGPWPEAGLKANVHRVPAAN
jgi:hypothetical protein